MDLLTEYLRFEGEVIQEELEMYEMFQSPETRQAVSDKRQEALVNWINMGKSVPEGVSLRD